MKRLVIALMGAIFALTMSAGVSTAATAAPAKASFCGIHWGSKAKHAGSMVQTRVQRVQAGEIDVAHHW
jgi:hypothetical protein